LRDSEGFIRLQEVGGRATQEAKAEYRLRAWDNITQLEGRGPTLFTQPTSRGSGDCIYANNSKNDQDTTDDCMEAGGRAKQEARAEEALSQEPLAKLRAKSNNQQVTLDNTLQVIDYWF